MCAKISGNCPRSTRTHCVGPVALILRQTAKQITRQIDVASDESTNQLESQAFSRACSLNRTRGRHSINLDRILLRAGAHERGCRRPVIRSKTHAASRSSVSQASPDSHRIDKRAKVGTSIWHFQRCFTGASGVTISCSNCASSTPRSCWAASSQAVGIALRP